MRSLVRILAALAIAFPGLATAQTTLRVVAHSDLKILDPIWTTAFIVRNHAYMIYDTLFALDDKLQIKPQMVETWTTSVDKLTWTFTLRDGLEFHDGQAVTTDDVVASVVAGDLGTGVLRTGGAMICGASAGSSCGNSCGRIGGIIGTGARTGAGAGCVGASGAGAGACGTTVATGAAGAATLGVT
jgi:ABC-type transport system substrate-binding protein